MASKFELKKSETGQFYFNLKSGAGEIILTSRMYSSKEAAEDGIGSARTNASNNGRYERQTSDGGDPYFILKSASGEIIGTSEMYASTPSMEEGIETVKRSAPRAQINDMTELTRRQGA